MKISFFDMIEDVQGEIWKCVIGYEGLYEVSNIGRIKALDRTWVSGVNGYIVKHKAAHIMKGGLMRGYKSVTFNKNSKQTTPKVHRLVAQAFLVNPDPARNIQVNHKNGIKTDNRAVNLEWVTPQENSIHSIITGLQVPRRRGYHSQAKRIKCETLDIQFDCIVDAAEVLGIHRSNIERVCNGTRKQTHGLVFREIN